MASPPGGMDLEHLEKPPTDPQPSYTISKTGNWFLADAPAKQVGEGGILNVTQNPGNLKSDITRHLSRWVPVVAGPLLYHAGMGAYTALWAAFSPDLTLEDGGKYVVPWGRLHPAPREDLFQAIRSKEEGGTGVAAASAESCSKQTAEFA